MWTAIDSLYSIRKAAAQIEGRDPADERCRQIAEVIEFARRMVNTAPRVEVHTRYRCPSATAAHDDLGRWVELLAVGGGYRLEFWEARADLDRPPTPDRVQEFAAAEAERWRVWAVHNAESWVCRAEGWRWLPPLRERGIAPDQGGG